MDCRSHSSGQDSFVSIMSDLVASPGPTRGACGEQLGLAQHQQRGAAISDPISFNQALGSYKAGLLNQQPMLSSVPRSSQAPCIHKVYAVLHQNMHK